MGIMVVTVSIPFNFFFRLGWNYLTKLFLPSLHQYQSQKLMRIIVMEIITQYFSIYGGF
jgi:hypothetical protein